MGKKRRKTRIKRYLALPGLSARRKGGKFPGNLPGKHRQPVEKMHSSVEQNTQSSAEKQAGHPTNLP